MYNYYHFKDAQGIDWTIRKDQISSITDITQPEGEPKTRLTLKELKNGANVTIEVAQSIQTLRVDIFNPAAKFTKQI